MNKILKNNYFYGKKKDRNNFIIDFSISNLDKKIMIIDLEEDISNLYPLTNLNTIKTILLNTEVNNILYYLELIDDVDTIIINGVDKAGELGEDHSNALFEEIDSLIINKDITTILLGKKEDLYFERNKKLEKVKVKKVNDKILKINRDLDLNMDDIYFIKRNRVKMVGEKLI